MADKFHKVEENFWVFECPACGCLHSVKTPRWQFNGDLEKPTVSPSILVPGSQAENDFTCHSFIKDGKIQFLGDCTHHLAGQTVDLVDW